MPACILVPAGCAAVRGEFNEIFKYSEEEEEEEEEQAGTKADDAADKKAD